MKKNLFGWLAMATMLVGTGCSSDDVVNDYSPENAIQFGTYVGRDAQGRASVIDDAALQGKGFGVFAYHTNGNYENTAKPNFMYNQRVEFKSSAWEYSPVKYWPNNTADRVSFFAYAPYVQTDATDNFIFSANTAQGDPTITYTVNNTVKSQEDLLWAVDATDGLPFVSENKQSITGNINFQFKHALSRIGFKVQAMIDKVNQNNTGDLDNAADASESINESETTIAVNKVELIGKFHTSGDLNLNNTTTNVPLWNPTTPTSDRTFELDYNSTAASSNFVNTVAEKVTTVEQVLNAADSYIMVIPQTFSSSEKIKIKVTYTVTTNDTNLEGESSIVTNVIESAPFEFGFVAGNAYNFVLHLGLTSVKLSATVADWNTVDGVDYAVNVPINFN